MKTFLTIVGFFAALAVLELAAEIVWKWLSEKHIKLKGFIKKGLILFFIPIAIFAVFLFLGVPILSFLSAFISPSYGFKYLSFMAAFFGIIVAGIKLERIIDKSDIESGKKSFLQGAVLIGGLLLMYFLFRIGAAAEIEFYYDD